MQILLSIPESYFSDEVLPIFVEKKRENIYKQYNLSLNDHIEIANIGPGADWFVLLVDISAVGLAIWNFPTALKKGIEDWSWLIKKIKSYIRKKQLVSFDVDAAGLLAIDFLVRKYGKDSDMNLKDYHTFEIIDISSMIHTEKETLASHPHNYYVFTFSVDCRIVVVSVRSNGKIRIIETFEYMPYGLLDYTK